MMQKYTIPTDYFQPLIEEVRQNFVAHPSVDQLTLIVKFPLIMVIAHYLSQIMISFANRMNVQFSTTTAEKKQAIFESTLRLIKEFGFHGTPINQIAQEAGVATGTIYHYFASKDALIIELFQYSKERMQHATFKPVEQLLPYPDRFVRIWINLVEYYIQHPEVLSFVEQFFSSPYVKIVYPEDRVCFQDEVSNFLKQGINEGHIKPLDINIISAAFIGTVSATAKRNINGHFAIGEDNLKKMVGIIWDGIKN